MKRQKIKILLVLIMLFSCKSKDFNVLKDYENKCGENKIKILYGSKKNRKGYTSQSLLFRYRIVDTVKVEYDNQIIKKYINTDRNRDFNLEWFDIEAKNNTLIKVTIGSENYCFNLNNEYYYYDFLYNSDGTLEIYSTELRNRNFE